MSKKSSQKCPQTCQIVNGSCKFKGKIIGGILHECQSEWELQKCDRPPVWSTPNPQFTYIDPCPCLPGPQGTTAPNPLYIVGPTGVQGQQGETIQGEQGPQGDPNTTQGITGPTGYPGYTGPLFNVVTSDSQTGPILTGPFPVNKEDTLRLWSAGGIETQAIQGSALVQLEPANILMTPTQPTNPPKDPTRPSVYIHQTSGAIYVWDPNSTTSTTHLINATGPTGGAWTQPIQPVNTPPCPSGGLNWKILKQDVILDNTLNTNPTGPTAGSNLDESEYGNDIAISGNTWVVAAKNDNFDQSGLLHVYQGSQLCQIISPFSANFGYSVDISGDYLITGDPLFGLTFEPNYVEDFESSNGGWTTSAISSPAPWQWGISSGLDLTGCLGTRGWATNLSGTYNNSALEYLESPVINVTNPQEVQLRISIDTENSWDGVNLWVSADGGAYQLVGVYDGAGTSNGNGVNWYLDNTINGLNSSGSQDGWSGRPGIDHSLIGCVLSTHNLTTSPDVSAASTLQFRLYFGSDGSEIYNGFYLDEFTVIMGISRNSLAIYQRDLTTNQFAYLRNIQPSNPSNSIVYPTTNFGKTVRISSHSIVGSDPDYDNNQGQVLVYDLYNTDQSTRLLHPGPTGPTSPHFGESIDLHQETLVIGAPDTHSSSGAVYIYRNTLVPDSQYPTDLSKTNHQWDLVQILTSPTTPQPTTGRFGSHLSITRNSTSTIVISEPDNSLNRVHIYQAQGKTYYLHTTLDLSPTPDLIITNLRISGSTLAIAQSQANSNTGRVLIYQSIPTNNNQIQTISSTTNQWTLTNTLEPDTTTQPTQSQYGRSLDLSGNTLVLTTGLQLTPQKTSPLAHYIQSTIHPRSQTARLQALDYQSTTNPTSEIQPITRSTSKSAPLCYLDQNLVQPYKTICQPIPKTTSTPLKLNKTQTNWKIIPADQSQSIPTFTTHLTSKYNQSSFQLWGTYQLTNLTQLTGEIYTIDLPITLHNETTFPPENTRIKNLTVMGTFQGCLTTDNKPIWGHIQYYQAPGNIQQLVFSSYNLPDSPSLPSHANIHFKVQGQLNKEYSQPFLINSLTTFDSCPGLNNGEIHLQVLGRSPINYFLTPGDISQTDNPDFYNLSPNTYTLTITDLVGNQSIETIIISDELSPTNLLADNIHSAGANLNWIAGISGITEWDIAIGQTPFTPVEATYPGVTTIPYGVTGLNPLTEYEFYVRENCRGNTGAWIGPSIAFTTLSTIVLNGNYTLDSGQPTDIASSGTNFNSFTDLEAILYTYQVGPLGVNVTVATGSGPYNEQVTFRRFPQINASQQLTIDGNGETLFFNSSNSNARYCLQMSGTQWVHIKNLTLQNNGTYGWTLQLTRDTVNDYHCQDLTFTNCQIISNITSSTNSIPVLANTSLTSYNSTDHNPERLTFDQCTIRGGYFNFYFIAPTGNQSNGHLIKNCTFEDTYSRGISLDNQDNVTIEGNDLSNPTRTFWTSHYVINGNNLTNSLINRNQLHDPFQQNTTASTFLYGIYLQSGSGNRITNNLIYNFQNNGQIVGIYNNASGNEIYYNTIDIDNPTATTTRGIYGIYINQSDTIVKNNLITMNHGGSSNSKYLFYSTTSTPTSNLDYNQYFQNSLNGTSYIARANFSNYSTFSLLQGAGFETNGVEGDPIYDSNQTPQSPIGNEQADPTVGVTGDFYNNLRDPLNPDIGHTEFEPGCIPPQNLISSDIQAFQATLDWDDFNDPTPLSWEIELGTGGFVPTGNPTHTTTTHPTEVTGLDPLTTYDWYVRARCGATGVSDWSASNTFDTLSSIFLNGDYTLDSGQPTDIETGNNFNSFNDLSTLLQSSPIGPLGVNVTVATGSGPYNEQVIFPRIDGLSSSKKVTINGNNETISFNSSDSNNRHVIRLFGTNWFEFSNLTIQAAPATYGWTLHLYPDTINGYECEDLTFTNCTFECPANTTSFNFQGVTTSASLTSPTTSGSEPKRLTFTGCQFLSGYYGLTLIGNNLNITNSTTHVITNNLFRGQYSRPLYLLYFTDGIVENNEITVQGDTRTSHTIYYGIYIQNITQTLINRNRIHDPFYNVPVQSSVIYGIYVTTSSSNLTLTNNLIYNFLNSSSCYGLYFSSSFNCQVIYNTVNLENLSAGGSGTISCLYSNFNNDPYRVINNIFAINHTGSGTKHCVRYTNTYNPTTLNYNQYYQASPSGINYVIQQGGSDYSDLSSYQLATSYETNGVEGNPFFAGNDQIPVSNVGHNLADPTTGITTDFLNQTRDPTNPDIGHIEYVYNPEICLPPSNLITNGTTDTTANLEWTDNNASSPPFWDLEIGLAGFTPTGNPTHTTSTNPTEVTGLSVALDYEWYVRAVCNPGNTGPTGISDWSSVGTFTTQCVTFTAPITETFGSGSIPNCWNQTTDQSENWLFDFSSSRRDDPGDGTPGGGGFYAWIDWSGSVSASQETNTLFSPLIDVSGLTTPTLKFLRSSLNTFNPPLTNQLRVEYWDGSSWHTLQTFADYTNGGAGGWQEETFDLNSVSPASGDIQIAFTSIADPSGTTNWFGHDIYIDDFKVEEP